MKICKVIVLGTIALLACNLARADHPKPASQLPLLVIGASYGDARTPFANGAAPLGGIAVGLGSYLSLGNALVREQRLPGYVINEAQAGATTFARPYCAPGAATCGPAGWDNYQTQLERAIARVAIPPAFTSLNAKYVIIGMPNDCLHADAFGIPQNQTQSCTLADMNLSIDRLIAVGQYAIAHGLTPIYDIPPRYDDLDLPLFGAAFGLDWVISEGDYTQFRTLHKTRIKQELPAAVLLDMWPDFEHGGDGIHPNDATSREAAKIIAKKLLKLD